jgi:APA family basic amino acid/polyamine antiporter
MRAERRAMAGYAHGGAENDSNRRHRGLQFGAMRTAASTARARLARPRVDLLLTPSVAALACDGDTDAARGRGLWRGLSATSLVLLGVGCIIGAGIFVLTGTAAATNAGPAVSLSFLLGAAVCAMAGLCYAEMASAVPVTGSAYTYAYATLGEIVAWIIGWDLILEYAFGAVAVAIGWSGYAVSLSHAIGLPIGARFTAPPLAYDALHGTWAASGAVVNAPAMLIVAALSALLVVGTRESAALNNVIVAIKVTIILVFVVAGACFVNTANWITPSNPSGAFIPPNQAPGVFGWSGVLRGAAVVFFAYIGFDAVSTAAQESRDPRRSVPIGILASLAICALLYVAVSAVLTGIVPYDRLNVAAPIAVGIDATGLTWLEPLVSLGAVLGLTSAILVLLLGQSRILFAMARDGLLPPWGARIHPRFRTPVIGTLVTGGAAALGAGVLPLEVVAQLVSIGTLMAFAVVCLGVLRLRITQPLLPRPFKAPALYVVAPAGALSAIALMLGLPSATWLRLLIWGLLGLAVYGLYGVRHSRAQRAARG